MRRPIEQMRRLLFAQPPLGSPLENVRAHPGWEGVFTTDQYPGAWPAGTRVRKVAWEPGDMHDLGSLATVLGSIGHSVVGIAYFVEFDEEPKRAVMMVAAKVGLAPDAARNRA